MKHGLLIGNSHLAAVASAVDLLEEPDIDELGFTMDRFGLPGENMDHYEVSNGVLGPMNDEARAMAQVIAGKDEVSLKPYDFIVLSGMHFSIFLAMRVFRRFGTLDMPSLTSLGAASSHNVILASDDMVSDFLLDYFAKTNALRLARQIRATLDIPIMVVAQPRPSAKLLKDERFLGFRRVFDRGDAGFVSEYFDGMGALACAQVGAEYISQPASLIDDDFFTKDQYMRGSVRLTRSLDQPHPKEDFLHANAQYGVEILREISKRLPAV